MSRRKRENELLALRFPFLSEDVREQITETQKLHKCSDTSDLVIDRLWMKCRSELRALVQERSGASSDIQPVREPLSDEAREIIRAYLDHALKYEGELMDEEDEAFEETYRRAFIPIHAAARKRREQLAQERDRWDFFNKPDADADYEQWRGKMLWPAQAVALSLGKDPEVVNPVTLEPFHRVGRSVFRETFKYRFDLIEAAIKNHVLRNPMSAESFASWAHDNKIGLPPEFASVLGGISDEARRWERECETCRKQLQALRTSVEDIDPKLMKSVYTVILGMAVAKFGHRTDKNSPATTKICNAIDQIEGLHLRPDAVRGLLYEAANALDFHHSY